MTLHGQKAERMHVSNCSVLMLSPFLVWCFVFFGGFSICYQTFWLPRVASQTFRFRHRYFLLVELFRIPHFLSKAPLVPPRPCMSYVGLPRRSLAVSSWWGPRERMPRMQQVLSRWEPMNG